MVLGPCPSRGAPNPRFSICVQQSKEWRHISQIWTYGLIIWWIERVSIWFIHHWITSNRSSFRIKLELICIFLFQWTDLQSAGLPEPSRHIMLMPPTGILQKIMTPLKFANPLCHNEQTCSQLVGQSPAGIKGWNLLLAVVCHNTRIFILFVDAFTEFYSGQDTQTHTGNSRSAQSQLWQTITTIDVTSVIGG